MKKNSYQILKLNLDDLLEAKKWLVHSYQVCESFKSKEKFSVSDYDALESFLSRFARVCDLLFRKVFRSIDMYELEPQGSLLDVLNRSEKKRIGRFFFSGKRVDRITKSDCPRLRPPRFKNIIRGCFGFYSTRLENH